MKIFTSVKSCGPKKFTARIVLYTVLCAAVALITAIMGSFLAAFVQTKALETATVITFLIIILGFAFVGSIRRMIQKDTTFFYIQDNKLYYVDLIKQNKIKTGFFSLLMSVNKLNKELNKLTGCGNKLPENARYIQHVENIKEKTFTYEVECKVNYLGKMLRKTFTLVKGYNNEEELIHKIYKLSDPNFKPEDHPIKKTYLMIPMVSTIVLSLVCLGGVGLSMPNVEILEHAFFLPMVVETIISIVFAVYYTMRYIKSRKH